MRCDISSSVRAGIRHDVARPVADESEPSAAAARAAGKDPYPDDVGSHSTENMVAVVAGRAGGLKTGQHIHFNNDRHPAQVFISLMKGVLGDERPLGEISGCLPEMFSWK